MSINVCDIDLSDHYELSRYSTNIHAIAVHVKNRRLFVEPFRAKRDFRKKSFRCKYGTQYAYLLNILRWG